MTLRIHPDEIVRESTSPLLGAHDSWERVRLGEVAGILNGFAFKSASFNAVGDGTPIVRIRDVGQQSASTCYSGEFDPRYLIDDGDLIVGMDGDFRSARWRGGPALLNQRVCKITITRPDVMSSAFLEYVLPGYLDEIARRTSAITVKHLSSTTLAQLPLPLPPRREQGRIVAALEEEFSRLDDAERLLGSARHRLSLLRKSVLDAVTRSDGVSVTLGEIAEVVGGVTKDSKRQGDPSFVEVPYLRVANVQRGYLDLREITTIRVPPEKAKALRLEPGDILFNEGGDRDKLGRGWVWNGEIDDCIHQNHVFRARLLSTEFDAKFVSIHGNTFGRRWFEEMGKQTTNLASINLKTLKGFPVPVLPVEEQRQRVEEAERQITVLDALMTAIEHALERSDHLRRAVLSETFSGRLVPQDANDEPVSELLARVATERDGTAKPRRRQRA